jgi:hypothetical protein
LLSPLELTCDLAGVPISSAVASSAIQAATTTAIVTSYITVTQSYYWQSSFATIATTVVIPVTDSNDRTVIVAFPVTIEPSTTIYGSPSTSTPPEAQATSNPTSTTSLYNFGTCNNPAIVYGYALDGESQYAFEPANQSQFPRGASPDIASVESFICRRLRDKCDASDEAQQACNDTFNAYSGLAGQNAADVWNIALGLPVTTLPVTTTTVTVLWTATASTSITTDLPTTTATATTTTTTTTTHRPLGLGDPGTLTATVTSTIVPGVSSGNANADGGGSPFDIQSFATQWRPEMLSGGMVLLAVIFALLY